MKHAPLWILAAIAALAAPAAAQEKRAPAPLGIGMQRDAPSPTVLKVLEGSTAEEMGLKQGDVITSVDGTPVKDVKSMIAAFQATQRFAGDSLTLEIKRGEEVLKLTGTLKPEPSLVGSKAPAWEIPRWGRLAEGASPPSLDSFKGKVVVLYAFQSW